MDFSFNENRLIYEFDRPGSDIIDSRLETPRYVESQKNDHLERLKEDQFYAEMFVFYMNRWGLDTPDILPAMNDVTNPFRDLLSATFSHGFKNDTLMVPHTQKQEPHNDELIHFHDFNQQNDLKDAIEGANLTVDTTIKDTKLFKRFIIGITWSRIKDQLTDIIQNDPFAKQSISDVKLEVGHVALALQTKNTDKVLNYVYMLAINQYPEFVNLSTPDFIGEKPNMETLTQEFLLEVYNVTKGKEIKKTVIKEKAKDEREKIIDLEYNISENRNVHIQELNPEERLKMYQNLISSYPDFAPIAASVDEYLVQHEKFVRENMDKETWGPKPPELAELNYEILDQIKALSEKNGLHAYTMRVLVVKVTNDRWKTEFKPNLVDKTKNSISDIALLYRRPKTP